METIFSNIKENWDKIVSRYNTMINGDAFFLLYNKTPKDYFKDLPTSERTKQLSSIVYAAIEQVLEPYGLESFAGNGNDYRWFDNLLEGKISLSLKEGWTGNGFKKTNWHFLVKLDMDENMLIARSFVALVPLNECQSNWSSKTTKSNFSTLKLRKEDMDKIKVCVGSLTEKAVYLYPELV
jgi:hypothetical protein